MTEQTPNRRRELRVSCQARILWDAVSGGAFKTFRLGNISLHGMYVVTDDPPPPGTEFRFELLDELGDALVAGVATVKWLHKDGSGLGAQFTRITTGEDELRQLVSRRKPSAPGGPTSQPLSTRIRGRGASDAIALGIDLGTSNTCAAAVINGEPQVIPTRYGTNFIPSVITINEQKRVLVGNAAARRMVLYPNHTVYGWKRLIGRGYRPDVVQEYQPRFAYPIVKSGFNGYGADLNGVVVAMEEVARFLLIEARQVAEAHLGAPIRSAVVTVPAHFAEVRRDAIRIAAKAAGLKDVRIVNEPTAAAVAYGFNRGSRGKLAVFDLGGGTFDISVLEVVENRFQVLSTGGDNFLGGIDIDDVIAGYLLDEFERQTGARIVPDPQQVARVREAAEEAKRGLSVQTRVSVYLPQFSVVDAQHVDLRATVSREFVEQGAAGLLERIKAISTHVLATAGLAPAEVDDVLLVGGMTRMPLVQAWVESFFGRRPSRRVHPDEAVALGAALLAEESDPVELVDVLPLSIGIAGKGRRFERLLWRNASVPAARTIKVRTNRTNQSRIIVPVFQGEKADAAANEYLGCAVIEDIAPGPAGAHRYELSLSLDQHCMLTATATTGADSTAVRAVRLDRSTSLEAITQMLGPYQPEDGEVAPRSTAAAPGYNWFRRVFRRDE